MPKRVHFGRNPVESYYRSLCTAELNILNDFEDHIWERPGCLQILQHSDSFNSRCPCCRSFVPKIWSMIEVHRARTVEKRLSSGAPTFVEIPKSFRATWVALKCSEWRKTRPHERSSGYSLQGHRPKQAVQPVTVVEYCSISAGTYRRQSWVHYSGTRRNHQEEREGRIGSHAL